MRWKGVMIFIIHKINFHRSGEVTTKSSTGERFGNEKSYSVSLENFKDGNNDLCFLQPVDWKIYPVVNDQKNYIELTPGLGGFQLLNALKIPPR